tara:strand:- start:226 stop:435 length:210 start_codon:yes stop_codon:yes gene_type:complete
MFTGVEVTDTGLTIRMVTTHVDNLSMVVDNQRHMDNVTMHTDTNLTQRGVLVVTELVRVTEVLEDVKVL